VNQRRWRSTSKKAKSAVNKRALSSSEPTIQMAVFIPTAVLPWERDLLLAFADELIHDMLEETPVDADEQD
jgi:hypothetical protein